LGRSILLPIGILLDAAYKGCIRKCTVVTGIARRFTLVCIKEWKKKAEVLKDLEVFYLRGPPSYRLRIKLTLAPAITLSRVRRI